MQTKNPRGAGRKPLPENEKKINRTIKLSPDLIQSIDDSGSSLSGLIDKLLRQHFRIG